MPKPKINKKICKICEETPVSKHSRIGNCHHRFCVGCLRQHTQAKLENDVFPVTCPEPGCRTVLTYDTCHRKFNLGEAFLNKLAELEVQSVVPAADRIWCPNPRCSELLNVETELEDSCSSAPCPGCRQAICLKCKQSSHDGQTCSEAEAAQRSGRQESALARTAVIRRWKQCTKCRRYIERTSGCNHMTCKCGHYFCYRCGKHLQGNHRCNWFRVVGIECYRMALGMFSGCFCPSGSIKR